ncbi:MAG: capsular polysaccharide biosynthesis protein [Alphaproteobacteria bacterium]|nr:MAG: capsular polysaccharide biosynthesis protein [Alphaproteobacteria bacterium]
MNASDKKGRALTASSGIARDPLIAALLGRPVKKGFGDARDGDVVVGWGKKKNTRAAKRFAQKAALPYWHLEDGFFAYLSHPAIDGRRMSMVLDRTGIYYDATAPSDLESLLNRDDWITPELIARADAAMDRIRRWRLSKYNRAPLSLPQSLRTRLERFHGPKVLIVDQTFGDLSLKMGLAGDDCFQAMLATALHDHPDAQILIKVHPDVLVGKKRSHFGEHILPDRVMLIADYVNPLTLMNEVDHVYVATSQMGFEALIAGKPVTCFGMPFYAGWGLTNDQINCPRRTAKRSLAELFAAACILYSRYIDPFTHASAELEDVLDILAADKQLPRPEAGRALAVGFSPWRRRFAPRFFGPGVGSVQHVRPASLGRIRYGQDDIVVLWGRKHDAEAAQVPAHVPVWRMEDGFLRSVGLGSDFRRPSSLVLDSRGIYYDGGAPSDLEHFLNTHDFADRDLLRGQQLIARILASRVSKYNVGDRGKLDFRARAGNRKVLLVPGQVETDASIQYGSPELKKNAALVEAVRASVPDAYIIFKPHPDVATGNRVGNVSKEVLDRCVDEIITSADIIDCLEAVDEIHTMTSLTGFEALLRGRTVVTYGRPFYAGWGLTTDRLGPHPRRTRTLPIEALVYGLLCIYARYVEWPARTSYSPEALITDIAAEAQAAAEAGAFAQAVKPFRKVKYVLEALLR